MRKVISRGCGAPGEKFSMLISCYIFFVIAPALSEIARKLIFPLFECLQTFVCYNIFACDAVHFIT
jgi:hypothetical protein